MADAWVLCDATVRPPHLSTGSLRLKFTETCVWVQPLSWLVSPRQIKISMSWQALILLPFPLFMSLLPQKEKMTCCCCTDRPSAQRNFNVNVTWYIFELSWPHARNAFFLSFSASRWCFNYLFFPFEDFIPCKTQRTLNQGALPVWW